MAFFTTDNSLLRILYDSGHKLIGILLLSFEYIIQFTLTINRKSKNCWTEVIRFFYPITFKI